jgi:hypothetical protein
MSAENAISGKSRRAGSRGLLAASLRAPSGPSESGPGAGLAVFTVALIAGLAVVSCLAVVVASVLGGTARTCRVEGRAAVSGVRRVIVGASGSPGSVRALRYAEDLARVHGATLMPVLAWVPPGGDRPDRLQPSGYLRREWEEAARHRLRDALIAVWGQIPEGLSIQPLVQRGEASRVVPEIAPAPMTSSSWGPAAAGRWPV